MKRVGVVHRYLLWVILNSIKSGLAVSMLATLLFTCITSGAVAQTTGEAATAQQKNWSVSGKVTDSAGLPVVVLGDFNAKPNTPEILALKNNGSIKLACAHQEKGNTYHAWTGTGSKKIDWIFYSNQLEVMDATVIPTSHNGHYPSDHFPIKASFKLKE